MHLLISASLMISVMAAPLSVGELVAQLKGCEGLETCAPVKSLVKRGQSIWPELQVGLDAPDEMTRFWTLGVLSEVIIKDSRSAIARLLDDKKVRIRAAAAYALGAHRDKVVTPWLLKALSDKDLNVRFAAVVGLGRVRDPASITPLKGALRDQDEDVRAYAALALGDIRDLSATPSLIERLREDIKPQVRGFAAMALSKLKDPRSLKPLMAQAKDEKDAKALAAALHALGELGDIKALVLIEPHLRHSSPEVRDYAKDAIATLKGAKKGSSGGK